MLISADHICRRTIPLFLILLVGFCLISVPAIGEALDIGAMEYDSLLALKQEVDLELNSRPEAEPFVINPGKYVVGSDIKPGKYSVIFAEPINRMYCEYMLFPDKLTFTSALEAPDEERNKYLIYRGIIRAIDRSTYIDFQEGNYLITEGASIKLSVTDYDDSDYFTYTAPEGAVVPLGTYTVGEEIPAGSYTAYPYDTKGVKIYIYKSAEVLAADQDSIIGWKADAKINLSIIGNDSSAIFKLDEGNIIIIDNVVVMTKNAAFDFRN